MKPAWLLGLLAVAAAVVWWLLLRHDESASSRDPGATTSVGVADPAIDAGRGAPPPAAVDAASAALVPPPVAPPPEAPTPIDSVPFEREARDPAWAVDQEHELRVRMDHVAELLKTRGAEVTITAAECRTSLCRLSIDARADKDLSALYGALETTDGLLGWADGIVLGDLVRDPTTARIATTVTVAFDR